MGYNRDELKKKDFLTLKNSQTSKIEKIVAPNKLQVGLNDPEFLSETILWGPATAHAGVTGSITKLPDGADYLRQSGNITLTTGSDGSITIGASAFTNNPLTVGEGLLLDSGTEYDGSAAKTIRVKADSYYGLGATSGILGGIKIDFGNLSPATVTTSDKLLFGDAGSSNYPRYTTVADILALGTVTSVAYPITFGDGIEDTNAAASDWDNTANATIAVDLRAAPGLSFSTGALFVDPNNAVTGSSATNDEILIYDTSATALRKISLQEVVNLVHADGPLISTLTIGNGVELNSGTTFDGQNARTLSVDADGSTISVGASGISVASVPNALTIGDGIVLNSGTTYDGSAAVTLAVDLKSGTALSFSSGELQWDPSGVSSGTATITDTLVVDDSGTQKSVTLESVRDLVQAVPDADWIDYGSSLSTTSSVSLPGGDGVPNQAVQYGSDIYFFVSGSKNARQGLDGGSSQAVSAFGGDVIVSGSFYVDENTLVVDAANNRIGIGDSSPDHTLDVAGNIGIPSSGYINIGDTDGSSGYGLRESSGDIQYKDSGGSWASISQAPKDAEYIVLSADSTLTDERVFAVSTGLKSVDAGAGSSYTISIDNSSIATLTGSQFSGNIGITGSLGVTAGISGSITTLLDGRALIVGSTVITVASSSGDQITVGLDRKTSGGLKVSSGELAVEPADFAGTGLEDDGSDNLRIAAAAAGDGLTGGAGSALAVGADTGILVSSTAVRVDNSVVATLTGSQFSGNVGITGSLGITQNASITGYVSATAGITGSLTQLVGGDAYLRSGNNVSLSTGSDGSITITATAGGGGIADGAAKYLVLEATASLVAERVFTGGTGISTADGGAGGAYTVSIDDSVVSTLTGSQFSGNVGITGSLGVESGITGSITKLTDGTAYLRAGNNVTISTGSDGSVTFNSPIDNSIVATLTGSEFGSNLNLARVGITGSLGVTRGISGSLTVLTDGTPYLIPGNNIRIDSGSYSAGVLGSITISATDGADKDAQYLVLSATSSLDGERVFTAGTGIQGTDGGAGGNYTLAIDDSVVATLTGSIFTGNVIMQEDLVVSGTLTALEFHTLLVSSSIIYDSGSTKFGDSSGDTHQFTGSVYFTNGASGSITKLIDGTAFISPGNSNVTITTASNGSISISSTNTTYSAGAGLDLAGTVFKADLKSAGGIKFDATELAIDDSVVATISGSTFTGVANFNQGLSGSLTQLTDGTSFIRGGSNVTIASGADGSITISVPAGDADAAAQYLVLQATASLENERVFNPSSGLSATDAGAGGNYTLTVDNSIVPMLSGAEFGSNANLARMGITGSLGVTRGISGSLTVLTDGTPYLIAGNNIRIDSGSDSAGVLGSVTISAANSADKAAQYLVLSTTASLENERALNAGLGLQGVDAGAGSSYTLKIRDSIVATLTGSQFSGNVGVTGSLGVTTTITSPAISGSLTHLSDGTSYLIAGNNIQISTGSSGAITVTGTATGDITAVTAGTGLSGGGSSGDVTLSADNSVLATLSGSQFSGNVGVTGSIAATAGLSGSLTTLTDGTSYLRAGNNITVTSSSAGYITIAADSIGDITGVTAGTGLTGGGTSGDVTLNIDNSVVATLSGSQFSGNVGITGSLGATSGLSGSLTKLTDGTSYMIAGSNVTVTSASNGAVTIASTDTTYTAGDGLDLSGTEFSLDLKSSGGLEIDSTELSIDDSVVATISGSTFTGAVKFNSGLSGSLTHLADGTPYIIAGSGISIASGSGGQITITGNVGDITGVTAGTGLTGGGTSGTVTLNIDNSIVATLTGSQFSGNVGVTGSLGVTSTITSPAISGSLTHISDGTSYLIAGNNIQIATGSSGAITITGTSTGDITSVVAGTGLTGGGASGDVTLNIDNSVVATLTGSQFSGNIGITGSLGVTAGLSGSLTHLTDGTSYLIAGSNITIATGSSGAVTVTASGGEISIVSGSSTVSNISTLNLSNLGIINDLGSGEVAVTGSIGDAEDGTYTDGLFIDFSTTTPVGTAVDRFNEVLKGLAPSAAPNLDDMDGDNSGTAAVLSFGSAQSISNYTNAQPSTLTPTDNLSDVNINGTYTSITTSNDIRIACFAGSTNVEGTLNADVAADGVNYSAYSFGDGDSGTLYLFVNDNSSAVHSVDLSVFSSGDSLNANGSGFFDVSAADPAHFADSSEFNTFKHRTGSLRVHTDDQRNGWNYARVTHVVGSATRTCNYVEWVNDSDSNALSSDNSAMDSLSMTGTKDLSGVKYNTGGTAEYRIRVLNAYRNVYSTSTISFNDTRCSVSSQAFPAIDYAGGEDETKILHVTGSVTITSDPILNQSLTVSTNVPHPLKSNLSSAGSKSIAGILLYDLSDNSSTTSETFRGEGYRLLSGSYASQSDVTDAGNVWDSSKHMSGSSTGHADGLLFYNQKLYAPVQGGVSGDFRNTSDGGSIANGPSDNVNYSGITSGTRTFYRYFKNTSGGSQTGFDITANGSGTIVSNGTSLSTGNITIMIKLPTTNAGEATGWMDLALAFATGEVSDYDGCLEGDLDSSLNATNTVTFGTEFIGNNEYVMIKLLADADFTGYINSMSVSWS